MSQSSIRHGATPQDISTFLKSNCKQLLGAKFWDTRFICRVDVGFKHDRLEARTLVLSKFRVFFLSGKTLHKLKVESSFHLLTFRTLEAEKKSELKLLLEDGKKLYLRLVDSDGSAMDVAREVLKAFKHYFPGCSDNLKYYLAVSPAELYAEYSGFARSRPTLPCGDFRRIYAALCDYHGEPFRDEVVWDVEKIYACHGCTELRLQDFTHLFPKDLMAITAVLQYSNWFTSLSADGVRVSAELADVIINVVRRSASLQSISLRECGLHRDFLAEFAKAVKENESLPLEELDLSKNTFDDHKTVLSLGAALAKTGTRRRVITRLAIADCHLNNKAMNGIGNALFTGQLGAFKLRKLDLSNNAVVKDELSDVNNLLSHCNSLEKLDLSNTGMPLDKIWTALKYGALAIKSLHLSGCTFTASSRKGSTAPPDVKNFFASVVALKRLEMTDCPLPPDVLKALLMGLASNQQVSDIHLDLSRSCQEKGAFVVLETSLPTVTAVSSLHLRDNAFDSDCQVLLSAVGRMKSLRCLDIGGSNLSGLKKHANKTLSGVLMELVKIISDEEFVLEELSVADAKLGVHLSVLLNALGVAPYLKVLDISGNDIGNFGARLLSKALQLNDSLRKLCVDRNQMTADAYFDLAHALKDNYTLSEIPYPVSDVVDACNKGDRVRTQQALVQLETGLYRNRAGAPASQSSAASSDEDHRQLNRRLQTQSRLTAGNLEDELNAAIAHAHQLITNSDGATTSPELLAVRTLLDDADKSKRLMYQLLSSCEGGGEAIDVSVDNLKNELQSVLNEKLLNNAKAIRQAAGNENITVITEEFINDLNDSIDRKAAIELKSALLDTKLEMRRQFSTANMSMACAAADKIVHEVMSQLVAATRNLLQARQLKTSSQTSLTQSQISSSNSPNASITPKSKRKLRLFHRSSRPKSIVPDPVSDTVSTGGGDASSTMFQSMEGTLSSSEEFGGGTTLNSTVDSSLLGDEDCSGDATLLTADASAVASPPVNKFLQIQKSRPRNPRKRYVKPTAPRAPLSSAAAAAGSTATADISVGMDDFFKSVATPDDPDQPDKEHSETTAEQNSPGKRAILPPALKDEHVASPKDSSPTKTVSPDVEENSPPKVEISTNNSSSKPPHPPLADNAAKPSEATKMESTGDVTASAPTTLANPAARRKDLTQSMYDHPSTKPASITEVKKSSLDEKTPSLPPTVTIPPLRRPGLPPKPGVPMAVTTTEELANVSLRSATNKTTENGHPVVVTSASAPTHNWRPPPPPHGKPMVPPTTTVPTSHSGEELTVDKSHLEIVDDESAAATHRKSVFEMMSVFEKTGSPTAAMAPRPTPPPRTRNNLVSSAHRDGDGS